MSRIGKLPIDIPAGVTVDISAENKVTVKGPLGTLSTVVNPKIVVKIENNQIIVDRTSEVKKFKAMHGLYRSLIANNVTGVSTGFIKALIINGVGYKVNQQGNKIVLNVGYSHPVEVVQPDGITFELPSATEILVKGIDKAAVGQCAANIKKIRKPDPYHVYGVRYKDEVINKKVGKVK